MPEGHPLLPEDPVELGAYRLVGRLGEGSQGVVYLGRDASGTDVAIKLLHARMAAYAGARDRFVQELAAAKKVARFCTAQVLDADLAGDRPYIVSEYVEGRSLRAHILADGPRSGGALERLAIGTLTALAAIHKAGIVHRDFTPHNVLLGPDGPRVIDFGIARALGTARSEETGSVGTPAYMSPEQISVGPVGAPADMFAWGATILFAATGRPPFGNESVPAVMDRILHAEPDATVLPEPLRSVVTACLAKEPALRPTAEQAQTGLLDQETSASLPSGPSAPGLPAPGASRSAAPGPRAPAAAAPAPATGRLTAAAPITAIGAGASAEPPPSGGTPARTGRTGLRRIHWAVPTAGVGAAVVSVLVMIVWSGGGTAAPQPTRSPSGAPVVAAPGTPSPSEPPAGRLVTRSVQPPSPTPETARKKGKEKEKEKHPVAPAAGGCHDYDRTYHVPAGTVALKVSVCPKTYSGDAVLSDASGGDGWDVCFQLRGHVPKPTESWISTMIMTSRDDTRPSIDNGPSVRYGAGTDRTEDWVKVNVGRCQGSGTSAQSSWQTHDVLKPG